MIESMMIVALLLMFVSGFCFGMSIDDVMRNRILNWLETYMPCTCFLGWCLGPWALRRVKNPYEEKRNG